VASAVKGGYRRTKEKMATKKSTLGTTLVALQKAEAQVEQLRKKAAEERLGHLKNLHTSFGFASRGDLIDALSTLDGGRRGRAAAGGAAAASNGKRRRARITPEMRSDVIKAIKAGDAAGSVAKRFVISIQSVQNIKKAAGLVQARKKRSKGG
jgi:hypothetical protein